MKKGQIKMFETIAVLIVFFILLFGGIAFYFQFQKSSVEKEKLQAQEQYSFQLALQTLSLAELDCSFLLTQRDNCIDTLKLASFKRILEEPSAQQHYFTEFGFSTITIREVYPQRAVTTIYDNVMDNYEAKLTTKNPILLYKPLQDTYAFGVMEVNVYV